MAEVTRIKANLQSSEKVSGTLLLESPCFLCGLEIILFCYVFLYFAISVHMSYSHELTTVFPTVFKRILSAVAAGFPFLRLAEFDIICI